MKPNAILYNCNLYLPTLAFREVAFVLWWLTETRLYEESPENPVDGEPVSYPGSLLVDTLHVLGLFKHQNRKGRISH